MNNSVEDREADLVIISTNDIHSNIDRIPKLATFIKIQREENKNVILLDAGDRQNGNPVVDYADIPGQPIIELMNMLGYNAATLGNHEFDYGQESLKASIEYANFDIVCANITGSNILAEFEPYVSIKNENKKIVILGLVNVDKTTHQTTALANKLDHLSFEDPVVAARQFKSLSSRADMFITLSHCGSYTDSVISSYVPQMNLIIGGGSHEAIFNAKEINGVLNTQTGSGLKYAGITKVWFHSGGVVECKNSLVDLDMYNDDEEFTIILDQIKAQKDFNKVIGNTNSEMDKTAITSLLCRSMMKSYNFNYAIYNLSGVNKEIQPAGNITLEDLYTIEPYKYLYYNISISIEALKNIIVEEYNSRPIKNGEKTLHTEGINYTIQTYDNGNIADIIFTENGKIITDLSKRINSLVNEHIYITYKHHIESNATPLGCVTDAVIDYYKP